ncbi:SIS domain-containing protein [Sporosarcina sp.]|uniref:SIS domain-containing protein n=1 Tax=Sporosarcina sp. TaxID=49982 RepID=UPI00260B7E52|nr:SIS domain-containing protein [Sporosarcina sp.]
MFNLTAQKLTEMKAFNTATEIHQQPEVWKETVESLKKDSGRNKEFINGILHKHDMVKVILTGAGTSAFAGDTLAPVLKKQNAGNVQFESIATTDIVSNPEDYFKKETPTILVSFARSGNSPESVAAVELGEQIVDDFYQVIITCNKDGLLAKNSTEDKNSLIILTPEKAHDQAMAMTSSFTSMILSAYGVFSSAFKDSDFHAVIENGERLLDSAAVQIDKILEFDFNRIIYLGSGPLKELSHEAALKMLELTAGQVVAVHESSLGFRHGPKSILDDQSVVVLFMSQNEYTRKYDMDILREIASDESGLKVLVLTEKTDSEIEKLADWVIQVNTGSEKMESDFELALLYVVFAQTLAMKKSMHLGITPDNPSPTGRINRVVQGVTIYGYDKE